MKNSGYRHIIKEHISHSKKVLITCLRSKYSYLFCNFVTESKEIYVFIKN